MATRSPKKPPPPPGSQARGPGAPPRPPGLGKIVIDDLSTSNVRTFRRELVHLYDFYIDEERRGQLAQMRPWRRWMFVAFAVLRGMVLKLSPARRMIAVVAIVMFLVGRTQFQAGEAEVSVDLSPTAFILLLLLLMLELKDKLLARDELAVGRSVQIALLPRDNPRLDGWDVWLYTRPANDVGGDLVDYIDLGGDRLGIVLGDVAGKGLGAALLMAKLQATVRALAPDSRSLEALAQHVNTILCRDGLPNRFATLVFVEIGARDGTVRLLNAGHLPPLVLRPQGVERLQPAALPLGMFEEAAFVEQRVPLEPGETIVLFSDGLTEAQDARGEFFGEAPLGPLLAGCAADPPAALGRRVLAAAERFVGEVPFGDDLSLVIIKRQ